MFKILKKGFYENMKKYLKFSGVVSIVLSIVLIVLLITSEFLIFKDGSFKAIITGKQALFGGKEGFENAPTALIAWTFIAISLILLLVGFFAPMINITGSAKKIAAAVNITTTVLLVVAGVLILCSRDAFLSTNIKNVAVKEYWVFLDAYKYSGTWVFLGILSIITGLITIVPAVANFIEKK